MEAKDRPIRKIIWIITIVYCLIISTNLSPIFEGCYTQDASLFLVLGKSIAHDMTPYLDVFDHKGPIMYLLEAPGWCLDSIGLSLGVKIVFLIHVIGLVIVLDRIYCTVRMWTNRRVSVFLVVVASVYVIATYGLGNTNEEFCVPLIAQALYLVCRDIKYHDVKRERMLLFMGAAFAFTFMIRANNASPIVGIGLYLLFEDVFSKNYKCLLRDIGFGLCGLLLITVPVCIYLISKGALAAMWEASITYNFHVVSAYTETGFIRKLLKALPSLVTVFICIICKADIRTKKCLGLMATVTFPCVIIGSGYWHYYAILVPMVPVGFAVVIADKSIVWKKWFAYALMGICLIIYARNAVMECKYAIETINDRTYYAYRKSMLRELIATIPEEERGDLMTYNCEGEYYLETDTLPNYKYFTLQSSMSNADPRINEEWNAEFEKRLPKWVVYNYGKYCNNQKIDEILCTEYEEVGIYDTYGLFLKLQE